MSRAVSHVTPRLETRIPLKEWGEKKASAYLALVVFDTDEEVQRKCEELGGAEVNGYPKSVRKKVRTGLSGFTDTSPTRMKSGKEIVFATVYLSLADLRKGSGDAIAHEVFHAIIRYIRRKTRKQINLKNLKQEERVAWAVGTLSSLIFKAVLPLMA